MICLYSHFLDLFVLEDKPRADFVPHKSPSPGPSESSTERREPPTLPISDSSSHTKPGTPSSFPPPPPPPLSTCNLTVASEPEELSSTAVAQSPISVEEETLPEATPSPTASSPSPGKAVNGLSESLPPSPVCEQEIQLQEVPLTSTHSSTLAQNEAPISEEAIQADPPAPVTQISMSPTTLIPSNAMPPLAPPPGLPVLIQPLSSDVHKPDEACGATDVHLKDETTAQSSDGVSETHSQTNSRKLTATGTSHSCTSLYHAISTFFFSIVVIFEVHFMLKPQLYNCGFAVVFLPCFYRTYNY